MHFRGQTWQFVEHLYRFFRAWMLQHWATLLSSEISQLPLSASPLNFRVRGASPPSASPRVTAAVTWTYLPCEASRPWQNVGSELISKPVLHDLDHVSQTLHLGGQIVACTVFLKPTL